MTAPTLPEFILARVAVDEASVEVPEWYCTDSARGEAWGTRGDTCPLCDGYMFEGTESATEDAWVHHLDDMHDRRRVLAQCAAYRTIVERAVAHRKRSKKAWKEYSRWLQGKPVPEPGTPAYASDGDVSKEHDAILRALATIWADHADYDERWRP